MFLFIRYRISKNHVIETAIAKLPQDKPGGVIGGGGNGSGSGGNSSSSGSVASITIPTNIDVKPSVNSDKEVISEPFDDLGNYDWAKGNGRGSNKQW